MQMQFQNKCPGCITIHLALGCWYSGVWICCGHEGNASSRGLGQRHDQLLDCEPQSQVEGLRKEKDNYDPGKAALPL